MDNTVVQVSCVYFLASCSNQLWSYFSLEFYQILLREHSTHMIMDDKSFFLYLTSP